MVVMVIGMENLVTLHSVKNVYLGEDLVVSEKVEFAVYSCLVDGGVVLGNPLEELRRGYRLTSSSEGLYHRLPNLRDSKPLSTKGVDELLS